jgi:glycosyltransferase involved in cell wall biosynthesis
MRRNSPHGIHVAHVIEGLGPGGAERLLVTNLPKLAADGFRNTVVSVFARRSYWMEELRRQGVAVVELNAAGYRSLPAAIVQLVRWARVARPDLFHTHLWAANIVGRAAGGILGTPAISSIHSPDYEPEALNDGSRVPRWKRTLVRLLDALTAKLWCTSMIAVSGYVRDSAHRRLAYPRERIAVIHNPIDARQFQKPSQGTLGIAELGIEVGATVLLHVGRVTPEKGLLYAIRALPHVLAHTPAALLVSVGETSDSRWLATLRAEADQLGVGKRVVFLGPRREIADLLRACDVFVFPSLYEGLGIALIEAMAAGCACVASDIPAVREVVTHDRDGVLVPPRDAEGLAAAITALLREPNLRHRLGQAAAAAAVRFRPDSAIRLLEEQYVAAVTR